MSGALLTWMDARRAAAAMPAPRRARWTVAYDVGGVEWCTDGAALWRTGAPSADRLAWTGLRAIRSPEDVEAMIAGVAGSARYPARIEGGRVVCARGAAEVDSAYLPLLSGELEMEYAAAPVGTPAAWTAAERVRAATGQSEAPVWPEVALCVRSRIGGQVVAVVCCIWSDPGERTEAAPVVSVADIPDPDGGGSRDWARPPDLIFGGRAGVLCLPSVSKWLVMSPQPLDGVVFADKVIVFALPTWRAYALLQSIVHIAWARFSGLASTMQATARYTPSTVFNTFPFPRPDPVMLDMLSAAGQVHYEARIFAQRKLGVGATKLFNRIHDPGERCPWVLDVRELQRDLDRLVCDAYGWRDIHSPCPSEMPPNPEGATLPTPPEIREIVMRLRRLNRKRAYQQGSACRETMVGGGR